MNNQFLEYLCTTNTCETPVSGALLKPLDLVNNQFLEYLCITGPCEHQFLKRCRTCIVIQQIVDHSHHDGCLPRGGL